MDRYVLGNRDSILDKSEGNSVSGLDAMRGPVPQLCQWTGCHAGPCSATLSVDWMPCEALFRNSVSGLDAMRGPVP